MAYTNKPSKPKNSLQNQPWSPRPEKPTTNRKTSTRTSNKVSRNKVTNVTSGQTLNLFYPQSIINWAMKQSNSNKATKVTNVTYNLNNQKYSILDRLLTTYIDPNSPFNNLTMTANGAIAYKTSGSKLVDINFAIGELRSADDSEVIKKFRDAFEENPEFALKWLFWLRDVREGSGERKAFRTILVDLSKNGLSKFVDNMVPYLGFYGRYDDMWELLDTPSKNAVLRFTAKQLKEDLANRKAGKPISLISKWIPSGNASSKVSAKYNKQIRTYLKWTGSQMQHTLTILRKYIDVVERKMSSDNWQSIDYEKVPSKASKLYTKAFMKHDKDRYTAYLEGLKTGKAKVNASVLNPCEIVHKVYESISRYGRDKDTLTLMEAMWKNLPDRVQGEGDTICVLDTSGSMRSSVDSKSSMKCNEVAESLAIYFAERCSEVFQNKIITFSHSPKYMNLTGCDSLEKKIKYIQKYSEIADTNIEGTFDLLLNTAIKGHLTQNELPKRVLILSDQGFNSACEQTPNKTLFQTINQKWNDAGYEMPTLIFWNILGSGRWGYGSKAIPVSYNEDFPCLLVSGYNTASLNMVLKGQESPLEGILSVINTERYEPIKEAFLKSCEELKDEIRVAGNFLS